MTLRGLVAFLLFCCAAGTAGAEQRVKLTSLEWPPYVGATLPSGGVTVAAARAAFAAVGWTLDVEFLPWKRAVQTAREGLDGVTGYFPEYQDPGNSEFRMSEPMGVSPVGFVEQAGKAILWKTIKDLALFGPIGVVDGYVNSPEFDAAVGSGEIRIEAVHGDVLNLKKVGNGRLRAAVIDRNVLAFLLAENPGLAPLAPRVAFSSKLLIEQTLHVAFRKSWEGDAAREALNLGLKLVDEREAARHRIAAAYPASPRIFVQR